jgi:serine/threonine-protein kinase
LPEGEKPTFGKYQVLELLGEGGMGRVWRGFDPDLEVPVAIKELKEQFRDQNNLERFYREAQIAAKCRHQNIVLITDLSKDPPYFAMEFLEAQELSIYIHKGKPLSLDRMVHILGQVCDGLGFLHKRGIFHRDLKPANIMLLPDDTVKIADFGISKAPFGQKTMTQVIMGTIPYMAPEQITTPSGVDARVDLWALGVILFELTQRKHPFPGEGDINTIFHIVHSDHAPFGEMPPEVAEPLRAVISQALRKNPEERIGSTKEFKALLRGLLKDVEDPEEIVFPWQPPTDSTMVLSAADVPLLVDPELVERARSLIQEIEGLPEAMRAVIESGTWEKAAERALLSKQVLAEGDPIGIQSAIRGLESQKAAINEAIQAGFDGLVARAETALGKGQEAEAAALYRQVSEGDPSRAEAVDGYERAIQALITRGRRNQSQGNLTAAVEAWKEVLIREPRHGEAARLIKEVEGDRDRRERTARALAAAGEAIAAGRPEEAQAAVKAVLAEDPKNAKALELRACAQKMIEEATRTLHADALREEGRRFLQARDFDRAKISFSTLIEIAPGDPEAGKALEVIASALEQAQRDEQALGIAADAEAALQRSDFQAAVGLFEMAVEGLPGDPEIARRLQTAQRRLDALLNAESEAGQREKGGDLSGALQVWEQVLKLQPGHPSAKQEMDRILALQRTAEEQREKKAASARRAAEAAWNEFHAEIESFRAIPPQDHKLLGTDIVGRAVGALEQMEAARKKGDEPALRDGAAALRRGLEKIESRRRELLGKKAPQVEAAAAAVEEALGPVAARLKEAVARGARESIARARKEAAGPAIHPLDAHVAALARVLDGIHRETQGALKDARARVGGARERLLAASTKNRRAVAKRPGLSSRIEGLVRQAGAPATGLSLDALEKLADGLDQAGKEIPTDPLRFLPHMVALAAALAAAGGFAGWRYLQAHTAHPYLLAVAPWGSIVSIDSEAGERAGVPEGESPFHRLELLPGTWTITVQEGLTGKRGTITATIPGDTGGEVRLGETDIDEGIRELLEIDPWFSEVE